MTHGVTMTPFTVTVAAVAVTVRAWIWVKVLTGYEPLAPWAEPDLRGSTARALEDLALTERNAEMAAALRTWRRSFPLAVYGTLKSGGENHHLIEGERLCEATAGGWVVFDNHLYPGLGAVALELYPFQDLDAFEEGYRRLLLPTSAGLAWVYV